MMEIPRFLSITEATGRLAKDHGVVVTRQTVYNWIKNGKRGHKLRATTRAGRQLTTTTWLRQFVEGLSQ